MSAERPPARASGSALEVPEERGPAGDLRCDRCGEPLPPEAERCPVCAADARVVVLGTPGPSATTGPRRRWPRAWSVLAGAAALVLLLWIAGTRTAIAPTPAELRASPDPRFPGSVAPVEFAHGRWFCANDALAAYVPRFLYYELNHPLHPGPGVQPAACFPSRRPALAAGFGEAPTPPGTEEAAGIFVVPLDAGAVQGWCADAARRLAMTVPCPLRLPNPAPGGIAPDCSVSSFAALDHPCQWGRAFLFDYGSFSAPRSLRCCPVPHVFLTAYRASSFDGNPEARAFLTCPEGEPGPPMTIGSEFGLGAREAVVINCPLGGSIASGQLLLRWTRAGETFEIGVPEIDRGIDLAFAILRTVELIGPDGVPVGGGG